MKNDPGIELRVTFRAYGPAMTTHRLFPLLLAPLLLTAACTQAPADNTAELQAKLTAAEARADAAEKRAKAAEAAAGQHYQSTIGNPASQPEIQGAAQSENQFGQPMNDTAPIDTAPVNAAPQPPGALTN